MGSSSDLGRPRSRDHPDRDTLPISEDGPPSRRSRRSADTARAPTHDGQLPGETSLADAGRITAVKGRRRGRVCGGQPRHPYPTLRHLVRLPLPQRNTQGVVTSPRSHQSSRPPAFDAGGGPSDNPAAASSGPPYAVHDEDSVFIEHPEVLFQVIERSGLAVAASDLDVLAGEPVAHVADQLEMQVARQGPLKHVYPTPAAARDDAVGGHRQPRVCLRVPGGSSRPSKKALNSAASPGAEYSLRVSSRNADRSIRRRSRVSSPSSSASLSPTHRLREDHQSTLGSSQKTRGTPIP